MDLTKKGQESVGDRFMDNLIIDYNETATFKGVTIPYPFLEEGLDYIKKNQSKEVCIWSFDDETLKTMDLNFLKDLNFIEIFHFGVNLTKKSNIEGLYFLPNLKELRWVTKTHFELNFSKLISLEKLLISYHKNWKNFDKLTNLKELYISSVKTENLKFISQLEKLELLRIINANIISLEGLEVCKNLKKLDLRRCFKLETVTSILMKMEKLNYVLLMSCKRTDVDLEKLKKKIEHVGYS